MLRLLAINYAYQSSSHTLKEVSLNIKKGDFLGVMGESGCGKSTLLKVIYGLLDISSGEIIYNNEHLLGPKYHLVPGHPFMKYLSQEFDLMPYISSEQNVGQFLSNFYPEEKKRRTLELLQVVGMEAFSEVHVKYLSGGQKQRIALARVLAKQPEILLLDEPFSQIDNFKKNELRYRLFEYIKSQKITCITATHDKNDLLPFADEIAILKNGEIIKQGTPKKLYTTPNDLYCASLISEINSVNAQLFISNAPNKIILLYPYEIKVNTKSTLKALVTHCYFKGPNYLIKAIYNEHKILIEHKKEVPINQKIGISCSKKIISQRLLNLTKK